MTETDAAIDPQRPVDTKPEEPPTLLQEHLKRPSELVLTVKIKRFFLFGVQGQEVKLLKDDRVIDHVMTDKHGQALFKLQAGEYKVTSGDKTVPIDLKDHATLRL